MRELIRVVKETYPHDDFIAHVEETLELSSQARAHYRAYDRAFSFLDQDSWKELSRKAVLHFLDHREGQLKQGFFNQLNDAFAYQFLARRGCSRVSVLRERNENGELTPDLEYFVGTTRHYCEVKTIGVSEKQIARWESESAFDDSIHDELSDEFFKKLNSTLDLAHRQISKQAANGLVFVVMKFDDFTMAHYDRYHEQLSTFLRDHSVPDIYIKIGIIGGKRIEKGLHLLRPEAPS